MSNKLAVPLIVFFLMVGLAVLSPLMIERYSHRELPVLGNVIDFTLIDSKKESFAKNRLNGKIWIASFFFSSCEGPCPITNSYLAKVEETFRNDPRVNFVSISVDPITDTPEVLEQYATKYRAPDAAWYFLTGAPEAIHNLSVNGFKLGLDVPTKTHSTRFVLVDASGQIRGYYEGTEPKSVVQLRKDIRSLL